MSQESVEEKGQVGEASRHWLLEGLHRMRKNQGSIIAAVVVLFYVFLAIFGSSLAPYDPLEINPPERFSPPSAEHWFGQDELGRDIFSRVIVGTRLSFSMGFVAVGIALVFGVTIGIVAGYVRVLDDPIMRVIDVMMAFPGFLLAVAIVAALGPSLVNAMIAVGISSIPSLVRITRSEVLSIREQDYTEAANAVGASHMQIMFRHILPNCLGPIVVYSTLRLSTAILVAAALSFLGLGAQPPTPEWGAMVSTGRKYLRSAPHLVFFPSVAIFFLVLAFNFLGDGLRDALDPKQVD